MSSETHTIIEFSRCTRSIKEALEPYFKPGSCDLCFKAIIPSPPLCLFDEGGLETWKTENWISRPDTVDGCLQDNRYKCKVVDGYPCNIYAALARLTKDCLAV